MRLALAVVAAALGAGCLPQVAPLEGRACDDAGRCPSGLACRRNVCVDAADADAGFQCPGSDPSWIFCSGFEEGSKAIWDDFDGNPSSQNELVLDPGRFGRADNHVGWLKEVAGPSSSDLVKVLPSSHQKLYARWWVKYRDGYDMNTVSGPRLHGGDRNGLGTTARPSGTDHFSVGMEYRPLDPRTLWLSAFIPGMYQDCPGAFCSPDSYPCVYDSGAAFCTRSEHRPVSMGPTLVDDRWYCMEMMVDSGDPTASASGANGAVTLWLDDVQQASYGNLWFRTSASLELTVLYLRLYHGDANHSLVGVYYDDLVVSTDRVGCDP